MAFLTFLVNLVTTEKYVKRRAAASDSHAALQAAANTLPNASRKVATNHIQNSYPTFTPKFENKNSNCILLNSHSTIM